MQQVPQNRGSGVALALPGSTAQDSVQAEMSKRTSSSLPLGMIVGIEHLDAEEEELIRLQSRGATCRYEQTVKFPVVSKPNAVTYSSKVREACPCPVDCPVGGCFWREDRTLRY